MKLTKFLSLSLTIFLSVCSDVFAQDETTVRLINQYGKFDSWSIREIKESSLIGGEVEHLYEFYGNPGEVHRTDKIPFQAPADYL
jgi:hypothetical protein